VARPVPALWLAIAVGDWPAALDAAVAQGSTGFVVRLAPLAEQARHRWRTWLRQKVANRGVDSVGTETLARAGVENLP
jgi:hypothetical protein